MFPELPPGWSWGWNGQQYIPVQPAPPQASPPPFYAGAPLGGSPAAPARPPGVVLPFRPRNAQIVRPPVGGAPDAWDEKLARIPEISLEDARRQGIDVSALAPNEVDVATVSASEDLTVRGARPGSAAREPIGFGDRPLTGEVRPLGSR